jgi:hypothetical protein
MAGELLDIGLRPKLVASFEPPSAEEAFREWSERHAQELSAVPLDAVRVEYGRTGEGLYIRVRIDEAHLRGGLTGS